MQWNFEIPQSFQVRFFLALKTTAWEARGEQAFSKAHETFQVFTGHSFYFCEEATASR